MSHATSHRRNLIAPWVRTVIATVALTPVLLPDALLTMAVAGLGSLLDPADEWELADAGDLWLDLPCDVGAGESHGITLAA